MRPVLESVEGSQVKTRGHAGTHVSALDLVRKANQSWFYPSHGVQVHLPSLVSPESQKDPTQVEKEEKQGKAEEGTPTSKRGEPARVKIFEGG